MGLAFILEPETACQIGKKQLAELQTVYQDFFPQLQTKNFEIEVNLFSNRDMQELNLASRQKDYPTDVLSFPLHQSLEIATSSQVEPVLLGTVVIAPQVAAKQNDSLIDLLHHGCLHIFGYDHESKPVQWQSKENAIIIVASEHDLTLQGIPNTNIWPDLATASYIAPLATPQEA